MTLEELVPIENQYTGREGLPEGLVRHDVPGGNVRP